MKKLTTNEIAERVNLSRHRITQMIHSQFIEAEKVGRDYLIDEKFVKIIENRPERRGRKPRKGELAA